MFVEKGQKPEQLLPTSSRDMSSVGVSLKSNRRATLRRAILLSVAIPSLLISAIGLHSRACGERVLNSLSDLLGSTTDAVSAGVGGEARCPQVDQLLPERNKVLWQAIGDQLGTDSFKSKAVEWLGGAVRVPTESYDTMGKVGEDPRWEKFQKFHDYLLEAFPLIHSSLLLTKVNTYGLVYKWVGSDASLKPLLLAAHQDVVPVNPDSYNEWVHPPFSGYFDGEFIWGRGSLDDKGGLIGIMSAIETLLKGEFQPARTIVLAFGFDEEISGYHGAREIGRYLEEAYGQDAFAMIIDEGGGYSEQYGGIFAVPAIGEKGYFDSRIEVTSPGGHSSIPPLHTTIGMLSAFLVELESNPTYPILDRTTPIYNTLQCYAEHAPKINNRLRYLIKKSLTSNGALRLLERGISRDKSLRSFVATTQAIDLIQGGVKANALPELAWAVVNHRIATQSSVSKAKERDTRILKRLAKKFDLTYNAFGLNVFNGSGGSLTLSDAFHAPLEPAPVTPTNEMPFNLLSGTIRATFNWHRNFTNVEQAVVAPGIMSGNTDTRHYWNLTRHIFRYNHRDLFSPGPVPGGIHTINEYISVDGFIETIKFFITFILNADEYEL